MPRAQPQCSTQVSRSRAQQCGKQHPAAKSVAGEVKGIGEGKGVGEAHCSASILFYELDSRLIAVTVKIPIYVRPNRKSTKLLVRHKPAFLGRKETLAHENLPRSLGIVYSYSINL